MKESKLNYKIVYNNYVVLSAKKLDKIIFVKTYDKISGEIFWFLGFDVARDLIIDIKRILAEDHKYRNIYFQEMFKHEDPKTFNESGFIKKRKIKEIV